MDYYKVIGIILASLPAMAGLIFMEAIKKIIEKKFSNASNKGINLLFFLFLIIAFAIPVFTGLYLPSGNPENNGTVNTSTNNEEQNNTAATINAITNAATTVKDFAEDISKNKQRKDSIFKANRKQVWVYQIGLPKNNLESLWEAYKKLKAIPGIFVFKESRKNFFIIKDDAYTEQQLTDSLNKVKMQIDTICAEKKIEIINLMDFCSKKETIIEGEKIRIKKEKEEIPCWICGKM